MHGFLVVFESDAEAIAWLERLWLQVLIAARSKKSAVCERNLAVGVSARGRQAPCSGASYPIWGSSPMSPRRVTVLSVYMRELSGGGSRP